MLLMTKSLSFKINKFSVVFMFFMQSRGIGLFDERSFGPYQHLSYLLIHHQNATLLHPHCFVLLLLLLLLLSLRFLCRIANGQPCNMKLWNDTCFPLGKFFFLIQPSLFCLLFEKKHCIDGNK